ncbi:hypothetical protein [Gracilinema caldarium]|uniref:hypothetical protein n=1 Tax=Gracilinema caldarium TaxID=215591 RepID=UPI0002EB5F5A|nr:hypothetical protein [Gracilinema caldarium]
MAEFRDEVAHLISDIDAATDRDIALVEDRVKTLKSILEDTDKRILAYKKEINRRSMEEQAYAELGRRQGRTIQSDVPQEMDLFQREQRAKKSLASSELVTPEVEKSNPKPRFLRTEHELTPKAPSFSDQVLELYEAGFSPELIASKLKVTVAEVDLAINVSGKKSQKN